MTIADRIKDARKEKNLTQEQLAKMCGYSNKSNISRIENAGDGVTAKQVRRIAEQLGVSVEYLMGYEKKNINADYIYRDSAMKELLIEVEHMTVSNYDRLLQYAKMLNKERKK